MKIAKILFYLFLISLPFGTRFLVYQFTAGFHEYETIFVYASDILLILFLISLSCVFYSNILKNLRIDIKRQWPLVIFLFLSFGSIFFAFSKGLAIYNFFRLALLVLMAFGTANILKNGLIKLENIFAVLAGSAILQSLIGIGQFLKQSSLGLGFLGESVLGPEISGAAKIVVEGGKILRAYGTFPHPNVLAAFLLLGLLSLFYLWLTSNTNQRMHSNLTNNSNSKFVSIRHISMNLYISIALFLVSLGLLFAFSRTAWAISLFITLFIIGYAVLNKDLRKKGFFLTITLLAIGLTLLAVFKPYILPRAQVVVTEPSVSYRLEYNKLALDLIKKNPFGVGIGNQVLYSVKNGIYQKFGMDQAWQWQPIHNIYLLVASETGILGGTMFLLFLLSLLIPNFKFLISKQIPNSKIGNWKLEIGNSLIMLTALLAFGLVDHFLWTLQPGRLMLWLAIGLLIRIKDRTE